MVGGENYGQGSGREHAALVPMCLGVAAVLAESFARIHHANLRLAKTIPGVRTRYDNIDLVIMRENTEGLFLRVAQEVAGRYPEIAFNDRIVDNLCMQLVQRPHEYDLLVLPNLFGDIVSDLCAGLVGGLGVTPGANMGETWPSLSRCMALPPNTRDRTRSNRQPPSEVGP